MVAVLDYRPKHCNVYTLQLASGVVSCPKIDPIADFSCRTRWNHGSRSRGRRPRSPAPLRLLETENRKSLAGESKTTTLRDGKGRACGASVIVARSVDIHPLFRSCECLNKYLRQHAGLDTAIANVALPCMRGTVAGPAQLGVASVHPSLGARGNHTPKSDVRLGHALWNE
jgi:hypothetical protein